jgi:hypothetical protein
MKIPKLTPSKNFLGNIRMACLVARLKNSDLPKVACGEQWDKHRSVGHAGGVLMYEILSGKKYK